SRHSGQDCSSASISPSSLSRSVATTRCAVLTSSNERPSASPFIHDNGRENRKQSLPVRAWRTRGLSFVCYRRLIYVYYAYNQRRQEHVKVKRVLYTF